MYVLKLMSRGEHREEANVRINIRSDGIDSGVKEINVLKGVKKLRSSATEKFIVGVCRYRSILQVYWPRAASLENRR